MKNRYIYEYSKLRGKIREVYGSEKAFAEDLGVSQTWLSLALNNKTEFTQTTISKSARLLSIIPEELKEYFFCNKS